MNKRSIGRNISFLTIAAIFRGGTTFVVNAYLARGLGPGPFGIFSLAFALNTIVFRLTAGGLDLLTTRDIARDRSLTNSYTSNVTTIRTVIVILTTLGVALFAWLTYEPLVALLCLLLALTWAFFYVANILFATFRAYEQMQYEAFAYIALSVFMLVAVIWAVNATKSIVIAGLAYAVAYLLLLVVAYALYVVYFKYWPRLAFDWPLWNRVWREGWPLAAANLLSILYARVDILVLSLMASEEELGWYNAAYNFVIAAGLVSTVIATALLPQLSISYEQNMARFMRLYRFGLLGLTGAGVIIGLLFTATSGWIITFTYGKGYEPSILAFQILSWAIVLSQLDTFTVTVLTAMNQVKITLYIMGAAVVIKTIFNASLIPYFGLNSAAVANLLGEFLVTAGTLVAIEVYRRSPRPVSGPAQIDKT